MATVNHKIKVLNTCNKLITDCMKLIQKQFPKDKDVANYLWKMQKDLDNMNRNLMPKLDLEIMDGEFRDIVKELDNDK